MRALLLLAALSCTAFAAPKPNILVIVADDLGYGELGAQGFTQEIPTPNIDSLAAHGTRFTSGYVSGVYCSPTRAGLLTGRYQQRFGHEFNPGPAHLTPETVGLDVRQQTLGNRLQAAGYTTAWFGKSHLGYAPQFHPLKRGFNHFYGFLGGQHDYLDIDGKADPVQQDGQPLTAMDYLTTELGRETSRWVREQQSRPWFAYLAFNAVHGPLQAPTATEARFAHIADPKRRTYAAMQASMDDAVGEVLTTLRQTGQEERTLIIFIADNGGPTKVNTSSNGPLRGFKGQTWEGGIRVAWMVQWKGQLPEGKVDARPVIQLDVLPTALAAAGVEPSPEWQLDGVNLLPYLRGENPAAPHQALFWRFGPQLAVRQGDWKLVKAAQGGGVDGPPQQGEATLDGVQLYNLAQDLGEQHNVAAEHPDQVGALTAAWTAWNQGNVPAAWPAQGGGKRQGRQ